MIATKGVVRVTIACQRSPKYMSYVGHCRAKARIVGLSPRMIRLEVGRHC